MNSEVRRAVELAISRLSPEDLAERVAWCEEHGDGEVEPREPQGLGVDLHWGGKLLTTVHVNAIHPRMAEDPVYRTAYMKYRGASASESSDRGPIMISANRAATDATPGGPPEGLPPRKQTRTQDPAGPPEGLP